MESHTNWDKEEIKQKEEDVYQLLFHHDEIEDYECDVNKRKCLGGRGNNCLVKAVL